MAAAAAKHCMNVVVTLLCLTDCFLSGLSCCDCKITLPVWKSRGAIFIYVRIISMVYQEAESSHQLGSDVPKGPATLFHSLFRHHDPVAYQTRDPRDIKGHDFVARCFYIIVRLKAPGATSLLCCCAVPMLRPRPDRRPAKSIRKRRLRLCACGVR